MCTHTSANQKKSGILITSGDGDLFPSSFLHHSLLVHLTHFLIPDCKNTSIELNKKIQPETKHLYLSFHNCFWFGGSQSSAQKERQQNILSLCRGSTPSAWQRVTLDLHLVLVTQTVDPWRGRLKASLRCISLGLAECCAVLSACSLVIDLMSFFRQFSVNTSATSRPTD